MWLVSHATPTSSSSSCVELSSPTHAAGAAGNSSSGRGGTGGSGATTPVRKISAHEFERGGLLKPIVNTIDGTPTFLSVSPGDTGQPAGTQGGTANSTRPQRRSRHELRHLDEKDLIFELVRVSIIFLDSFSHRFNFDRSKTSATSSMWDRCVTRSCRTWACFFTRIAARYSSFRAKEAAPPLTHRPRRIRRSSWITIFRDAMTNSLLVREADA